MTVSGFAFSGQIGLESDHWSSRRLGPVGMALPIPFQRDLRDRLTFVAWTLWLAYAPGIIELHVETY